MPKKATNPTKKAKHATAWQRAKDRKSLRVAEETDRYRANRAAGKPIKQRKRKHDNMRLCLRCRTRTIVAGSVCWCKDIGADQASRRAAR